MGLIDASDQLQKHIENLKPAVSDAELNPKLDNWFAEDDSAESNDVDTDNIDQEYVLEKFPEVKDSVERINDMLREESSYILRQANSAINKANKPDN